MSRRLAIGLGLFLAVVALAVGLIVAGIQFKDFDPTEGGVQGAMVKKLEILSKLRIDLLKSADAEKSSVMADTDEASVAFAEQSFRASEDGERERQELSMLIQKYPADKEVQLLQEFDTCWTELQKIDRVVLDYAVQNTNLKAARLSFGESREALQRFEDALAGLTVGRFVGQGDQIALLVGEALAAALKIQVLHAPHIASPYDAEMDQIEATMRQNEEAARKALKSLTPLVPQDRQAALREAESAFDEFAALTARVIDLSRQNTNIKSFEISLGRKRKIAAQCDEILASLQGVVQSRSFKATR
jgi:hypothetical protein